MQSLNKPTWLDIGDGGVKAEHDDGDFTGAIITYAQVVQGGNGLWTPWVGRYKKGRPFKRNKFIRTRPDCIGTWHRDQTQTREEAIAFCEKTWGELFSV